MRVPFDPNSCQHLLFMVFLVVVILKGVRWNVSVVFICISFMSKDGDHFLMCFLGIWTSSFEKTLFRSFAHVIIGSLIFLGVQIFEFPVYSGNQSLV
jgi:hypothetical protein